jgi:hypothetical protein
VAEDFVAVGGLESAAFASLAAKGHADMIWADPPWGPGLLSYFYTLNKGRVPKLVWDEFLTTFCGACIQMCPTGPVYVVMGNQWADEMAERMAEFGLREIDRAIVHYPTGRGAKPCTLWLGSTSPQPKLDLPAEIVGSDTKAKSLLRVVVWCIKRHQQARIVLDLCCGKGQTAKAAIREGRTFWGLELNPDRAEVTRSILSRRKTGT